MPTPLRQDLIQVASEVPALRPLIVGMLRMARQTQEPIRLKYVHLGDFGGTDPVQDSYVLEVKGPYEGMKPLISVFKRHKMQWNQRTKSWSLHATLYKYNNQARQRRWSENRRNQEAAYRELKPLVEQYNKETEEQNRGLTPSSTSIKDVMDQLRSHSRLFTSLQEHGIEIKYQYPNRYSADEASAWVFGNTYPIKDLMKKHGFRWGRGKNGQGWWIPLIEFPVIVAKWAADVFRTLPKKPEPTGTAVFTEMSLPELTKWLEPVVEKDMEDNDWYDGEVTEQEVMRGYIRQLRSMKPHEQQKFFDKWNRTGRVPR